MLGCKQKGFITQVEWLNLEGFENRSIWLVSISQMRPLERLYTATFSAYVTANKIDEKEDNIEGHFATIYNGLYNSVDDHDDLIVVAKEIELNISESSSLEVKKITPVLVKEAARYIKPNKSNPA